MYIHIHDIDYTICFLRNNTRARARAHTLRYVLQTSGNVVQSEWVNRIKYNGAHAHVYIYTGTRQVRGYALTTLLAWPSFHWDTSLKRHQSDWAAERWIAGVVRSRAHVGPLEVARFTRAPPIQYNNAFVLVQERRVFGLLRAYRVYHGGVTVLHVFSYYRGAKLFRLRDRRAFWTHTPARTHAVLLDMLYNNN